MKDKLYLSPKLYVGKSSTHGYGVFTSEDLKKSEIVEQAYYIIPDNEKWEDLDTKFTKYFFSIPFLQDHYKDFADQHDAVQLSHVTRPICVLGFGMIYNHTQESNIDYTINERSQIVQYKTNQSVSAGSELKITYNPYAQF